MKLLAVMRTSWKDPFNLRLAADIIAGLATLALATAISVLSIAFSNSAGELLTEAMEPTRTVANVMDVAPRSALFTTEQFNELNEKIDALVADESVSEERSNIVTAMEEDVFILKNASCTRDRLMSGIRLWSAAADSPFLSEGAGVRYLSGGPFNQPGGHPDCAQPQDRDDDCLALESLPAAPDSPDGKNGPGNAFRVGVIVNLSYLKEHSNLDSSDLEKRRQKGAKLPTTIPIEFAVADRFKATGTPDPRVDLCVSGIIDEPTYPDLIFTEGLARAFYLAPGETDEASGSGPVPRGIFHGRYAADMWQWETDRPLVSLSGGEATSYFPETAEELDYVGLREAGFAPYDRIRLNVINWTVEGERERIRDILLQKHRLPPIEGESAGELIALMRDATTGAAQEPDDPFEDAPDDRVRAQLRQRLNTELAAHAPDTVISPAFKFDAVGTDSGRFRLQDTEASVFLELAIEPEGERVTVHAEPAWRVFLGDARLARALQRLQGVIGAYEFVMFLVVLVLAASASLLLAFGHVVRKTRDIGLLLTNGARPAAVFAIYMGQIAVIAVAGWVVGTALSHLAAYSLETYASKTLDSFLKAVASEQDMMPRTVLEVTSRAVLQAFLWVVPAALVGGIYPVLKASRSDPLSNLSKVG